MSGLLGGSEAGVSLRTNNKETNGSVTLVVGNDLDCFKDEMDQRLQNIYHTELEHQCFVFLFLNTIQGC
jgi:hypothetical protein